MDNRILSSGQKAERSTKKDGVALELKEYRFFTKRNAPNEGMSSLV